MKQARNFWMIGFLFMAAGLILPALSVRAQPQTQTQMPSGPAQPLEQDESKRVPLQQGMPFSPRTIVTGQDEEAFKERLNRFMTLDVRDMNVVDILRFLAIKGNFNVVLAGNIQGRVTLFLQSVRIKDALDLVVLTNDLAYVIENDIVRVMPAADYTAVYGKPFNDQQKVAIVQLQYVKPAYALSALENVKSALGRIIIDEDTGSVVMIDTQASLDRMKKVIEQIEQPLQTIVYSLQYAKAADVVEKFRLRIDSNAVGSVSEDERSNKLIVRAYPGRQNEIEALIRSLDEPTKEVLIEARVLQISFKPQMDYGIDWNLDFRKSSYSPLQKLKFSNLMMNEGALSSSSNLTSQYARIGYGDIDVNSFDVAIRALKQVNNTRILSNPKILVTNNQEAKIHVGDTVPYIISTTSGTGENAITSEAVEFVDVGLKLNVIPTINDDGFITMTLKPELSTVVGQIASQGGGIPQVNKTLVETTVMVKDGMTVVLGGLKKDNKLNTVKGIPVLMDAPLIGRFFRSESETMESTEIVIFITPHIVRGDEGDYNFYRGDIRSRQPYEGEGLSLKPSLGIKP